MDTLTFPSRAALVWALSVVAACGSDPATAPTHNSANGSDEDEDVGKDDESTSDDTSSDSTSMKDGGKVASKDAGGSGKMDAAAPGSKDAGKSASDAGGAKTDAGVAQGMDAGRGSSDAGPLSPDTGTTSSDAGSIEKDAGSGTTDAGEGAGDGGATTSAGSCSGATPHGCYVPESDNPTGCPPQIHEQSAYYPPRDEWVACSSPYYARCNYTKPGGGAPAHCECDLGLHWLCTY